MTALYITERDIEALARLANKEAESIARVTGNSKAAYGSVAEAVMNRAMSGKNHLGGSTISDVINKPWQFSPINKIGNWEKLPPAPPEVKEAVRQHLADLQAGKPGYIGKRTHYLPDTENEKNTWAKDWQSWPSIGVPPEVHYFGSPDPVSIPDYVPMYEPAPIPTPRPEPNTSIADEYAYAALTRGRAPSHPVDRKFHTEASERHRLANDLLAQGLLGLDGRTGFKTPTAERFAEPAPQAPPPAWDSHVQRLRDEISERGLWPATTEKGSRLPRVPRHGLAAPDVSLREFAPIPLPRPQDAPILQPESVPIPQRRPEGCGFYPDATEVRRGAVDNPRSFKDLMKVNSLAAAMAPVGLLGFLAEQLSDRRPKDVPQGRSRQKGQW